MESPTSSREDEAIEAQLKAVGCKYAKSLTVGGDGSRGALSDEASVEEPLQLLA